MLPSLHGDALRTSPTIGVKQRNGVQLHVGVFAGKRSEYSQRVQVQRAVRQRDSLGRTGAAAGVEQLGNRLLIVRENVGALGPSACKQVL